MLTGIFQDIYLYTHEGDRIDFKMHEIEGLNKMHKGLFSFYFGWIKEIVN